MSTTHHAPSQPTTAALRIGGAAALAFVALLSVSAMVGAPPVTSHGGANLADKGLVLSQSAAGGSVSTRSSGGTR